MHCTGVEIIVKNIVVILNYDVWREAWIRNSSLGIVTKLRLTIWDSNPG